MISKLRLFIILIICGSIVLLVTHHSLFDKNSLRVVNSVSVFTHNHYNDHPDNGKLSDVNKFPEKFDKKNIVDDNKGSFRKHGEDKPIVNIKVEKDVIEPKEPDVLSNKLDRHVIAKKQEPNSELTVAVNNEKYVGKDGETVVQVPKETTNQSKQENISKLPLCSKRGVNLVGPLFIDQTIPKDMKEIEKSLSVDFGGTVETGGWWEPTTCTPRVKVAVVIPYRNRFEQLKIFLRHLHPFLQRQQLHYRIIVVDQLSDDPFNRAGLFNIGFVEALKLDDFNCFVFSDVDLLPEDDRNYYGCPTSPRHMSVGVDKFNYKLPYRTIFGGVGSFKKDDFEKINGMSNLFWGWGGEDDDLYQRITQMGFQLTRPSMQIGRYTMVRIHHFQSSKADPNRMNLLQNSKQRMVADGLNTLKYNVKEVVKDPLVTFLKVEMKRSMYIATR